jgi:hypothetical protein
MPLEFPATATCEKCSRKTIFKIVVTKLHPHTDMHLRMPGGWAASSKPESGELLITCPTCSPVLISIPPIPIDESDLVGDPATDPTLLAPKDSKPL